LKWIQDFWRGSLREENHLEYLDKDGMIVLKLIFEKFDGDMD